MSEPSASYRVVGGQLPVALVRRIVVIERLLAEVEPKSQEEWLDGFAMDADPAREIAVWEGMAFAYAAFAANRALPLEAKQEALKVTLDCSLGYTPIQIAGKSRQFLTQVDVLELLDHYAAVCDSRHLG